MLSHTKFLFVLKDIPLEYNPVKNGNHPNRPLAFIRLAGCRAFARKGCDINHKTINNPILMINK